MDFGGWGFALSVVAFEPSSVFNRIATISVAVAIAMFYCDLYMTREREREKFASSEN